MSTKDSSFGLQHKNGTNKENERKEGKGGGNNRLTYKDTGKQFYRHVI